MKITATITLAALIGVVLTVILAELLITTGHVR
jgi:hypothetical protein